jgi:hypothetical protein
LFSFKDFFLSLDLFFRSGRDLEMMKINVSMRERSRGLGGDCRSGRGRILSILFGEREKTRMRERKNRDS